MAIILDERPVEADPDVLALAGNGSVGLWTVTGDGSGAARSLAVGAGLSITNPAGTSGDPTIGLGTNLAAVAASGAVLVSGNQSGLAGDKSWTGDHTWTGAIVTLEQSSQYWYVPETGILYAAKAYNNATPDAGDIFSLYHEVDSQLASNGTVGHAMRIAALVGSNQEFRGNLHGIGLLYDIEDAAHVVGGVSELGPIVTLLHAKAGFTNHNLNLWNCDETIVGPTSGQEGFMGSVWMYTKRHSGSTIDSTHNGAVGHSIVTQYYGGPANVTTTSYPMDVGVQVAGWSGASSVTDAYNASATNGWNIAFKAGGRTSPWMPSGKHSKIGIGLEVVDHASYGIHVGTRWSNDGAGTGATGSAAYFESGAGGVGIWQAPDNNIPLYVGAGASGLAARFIALDNGANAGPTTEYYRYSASPAANDILGKIGFLGYDDGAGEQYFSWIQSSIIDPVAGTEDGSIDFAIACAGAMQFGAAIREASSTDTALMLRYHNGTSLVAMTRVTLGAADSAGSGYRALRLPN